MEAIRVVLRLEKERCEATEAEKSILRNYQGFGEAVDANTAKRYWESIKAS